MRTPGDGPIAAMLGAASAALYALAPFPGERHWDALMTASVLARPSDATARETLFFAHPLVIPLTAPFHWLTGDPLAAAALRESCFAGVVVALAFLAARSLARSRAAGVIAAVALALAQSRWRLASGGEEKEVALAFGGLFYLLYLDHRGLLALGFARWRSIAAPRRASALGVLLALACAVHLVNGLLALAVVADVLLSPRSARREAARDAARTLGVAALVAAPFFVALAAGPGGARTPGGIAAYFLEYHLSGEFVSVPSSAPERWTEAYRGARAFLVGERAVPWLTREAIAASVLVAGVSVRAAAQSPAARRLLAWIALLGAHFYFYQPWDPEAWGNAALAWCCVLACGALSPGAAHGARLVAAACAVAALAALDASALAAARRSALPAARFARGARPSPAPLADLARWVDARMEPRGVLLVSERLMASYFQIYTRRDVVVRDYLDVSARRLRDEARLTTLSLRFYTPRWTSEGLRAAAAAGRPVYLLTDESDDDVAPGAIELGYFGLRLGRWLPRELGVE